MFEQKQLTCAQIFIVLQIIGNGKIMAVGKESLLSSQKKFPCTATLSSKLFEYISYKVSFPPL